MGKTKKKVNRKYCSPIVKKESNLTCFSKSSLLKYLKLGIKKIPKVKLK